MPKSPNEVEINIIQGKTYLQTIRWEAEPLVYKTITGITKAGPVSITATAHGLKTGWRAAIAGVVGMTDINASHSPPTAADYHQVTVIDPNTVEMNDVNAELFNAYVSGGSLIYKTPTNLSGYTARMQIRKSAGSTLYETLTTENGGIALDTVENTISLLITDTATEAYDWTRGKYDLELISSGGTVYLLLFGDARVVKEVTV